MEISDVFPFGFPIGSQEKTTRPKQTPFIDRRNRLFRRKFNFPLKSAVNDACLIWRIIASKWWVLVVSGILWIREIRKIRIARRANRQFWRPSKNSPPGREPLKLLNLGGVI